MPPTTHAERTRKESVPALDVELADGDAWGLALPGPRLHPVVRREADPFGRPLARIELAARVGYPLAIRRLRDDLAAACRDDDAARSRDAFLRLATALLRAAHDVSAEEAAALLDPRRLDLARIARELIPAAFVGDADPSRPGGR